MKASVDVVGPVEVERVAHGGHCVGRHDGRVIFIRHTMPGEIVRVAVTERSRTFWRGDAIEVLKPSPDRVTPPCPHARECGGCDFQHVAIDAQHRLLVSVVAEQLSRVARIDPAEVWDGSIESVSPSVGWRTRMQWSVADSGEPGLRRHRSHEVVPIDTCLIAHPGQPRPPSGEAPGTRILSRISSTGDRVLVVGDARVEGPAVVREIVHGVCFEVAADGFWQVHPRAAETLVDAVLAAANLRPGDRVLDLYGGVGVFAHFLAGHDRDVVSVEGDLRASRLAKRNLEGRAAAIHGDVVRLLRGGALGSHADVVVLDPPRTGAKTAVPGIAGLSARTIVYVACDPAAFARDVAGLARHGYRLASMRAFALFPMTHHVECVGVFVSTGSDLR